MAWFGLLFFAGITSSLAMGTPWMGFLCKMSLIGAGKKASWDTWSDIICISTANNILLLSMESLKNMIIGPGQFRWLYLP